VRTFVRIASGVDAVLPPALADRFQVQPEDRDCWCVGPARSQSDPGARLSSLPSGPLSFTPLSSSMASTL